ncbi:hypothetical protein L3X38_035006 [Prunus dulcis]|uniref:Uncharacterized protein n=1 Tax=Prunus dulcis TaxID=3755 RepID=A0AAD4VKL9_PRUDU|nr:hypothetical protein L3X38_035006 [Prunus dulcis]
MLNGKGCVKIEGMVTKNTVPSQACRRPSLFLPKYLNEAQFAQSWPPLANGNGHVHGTLAKPSLLASTLHTWAHASSSGHGPSLLLYAKLTNAWYPCRMTKDSLRQSDVLTGLSHWRSQDQAQLHVAQPIPLAETSSHIHKLCAFGTLLPSHIVLRHASFVSHSAPSCLATSCVAFGTLVPSHFTLRHATLCLRQPFNLRHPCAKFSPSNVLLTRGLRGLWAVHYTAWKMNYGDARPVHFKLQVPNQEVPSYSRTRGTIVCTITDLATS